MSDNSQFFPRGGIDQNGRQKPAEDPSYAHETQNRMGNVNWPVLGVITRVHFADAKSNKSQSAQTADSGSSNKVILDGGYLKSLQEGTNNKGHRLECDVLIVQGLEGFTDTPTFKNVPLCSGFGGVDDFSMVVPKARDNTSVKYEYGKGNGDYCILQFIGGDIGNPIITAFYPSPVNTEDPPRVIDGKTASFRFNGVKFYIDDDGNFYMDSRDAGQHVSVGPKSGKVTRSKTIGADGKINVATKSDIVISAGVPDAPGQENALPKGKATFAASKEVNIVSSKDDVKIQAPYKNLKKAARQYDSVKVNGGELFEYILKLKQMLFFMTANIEQTSKAFEAKGQFDVSMPLFMASTVMKEFLKQDLPKSATGHITGGSNVCYIGSASFSGLDIGNAALGFSDEDLKAIQEECALNSAQDALSGLSSISASFESAGTLSSLGATIIPIIKALEDFFLLPPGTSKSVQDALSKAVEVIAGGGDVDTGDLSGKSESAVESASKFTDEDGNLDFGIGDTGSLVSTAKEIIDLILDLGSGSVSAPKFSELDLDASDIASDPDAIGGGVGDFYSNYIDCVNKKIEDLTDN